MRFRRISGSRMACPSRAVPDVTIASAAVGEDAHRLSPRPILGVQFGEGFFEVVEGVAEFADDPAASWGEGLAQAALGEVDLVADLGDGVHQFSAQLRVHARNDNRVGGSDGCGSAPRSGGPWIRVPESGRMAPPISTERVLR